jgi:hypothetical protein
LNRGGLIKSVTLKPTDVVSRSSRLAGRLFEERMLVITPSDSMLHRFNETGTFIWQQLEKPASLAALCAAMAEHFEGFDPEKDSADVYRFGKKGVLNWLPQRADKTAWHNAP